MLNNIQQITRRFCQLLLILPLLSAGLASASDTVIRVTGIPDENPTELMRKNKPLVDYLSKVLGQKVTYVPVTDYGAAVTALAANKIDFAWLGGFTYVQAKVLAGAEPLAMRDIDRKFKSVFIKHVDSGITTAAEFKHKTFAFGSKSSTSGHLMPRYFMETQLGINPDTDLKGNPVYSGAHDATVKMVESGRVQGGALNFEVWNRMVETGKVDLNKVKLVWTTPEYVDYVWAARSSLAADTKQKFKQAFLQLDASKPEQKAVLDLQGADKFVAASPADFDSIEKIARSIGLLK